MSMLQRSFYIPEKLYGELSRQARDRKVPVAELMRHYIERGLKKEKVKNTKSTKFLLKLGNYKLRGGPKNLAKEHDKFTWE